MPKRPRSTTERSGKRRRTSVDLDPREQPSPRHPETHPRSSPASSAATANGKRPRPALDSDADDEVHTVRTQSRPLTNPRRATTTSRHHVPADPVSTDPHLPTRESRRGRRDAAVRANGRVANGHHDQDDGLKDEDEEETAVAEDEDEDVQMEPEYERPDDDDGDDDDVGDDDGDDDDDGAATDEIHPAQPLNGQMRDTDDATAREQGRVNGGGAAVDTNVEIERMRSNANAGFSICGILESVTLHNFMNHGCFEFPIGPNVTIINGANGSGKSAIVAALQIGLGAKPGQTERATKLEDLIQHGKDSAMVVIKILNKKPSDRESDFTYKNDVYGDIITIERKLFRGRTAQWALKTKGNRLVKLPQGITVHREVMEIVDYFGFNVKNPVSILTQTKSKQFLGNSKPTDHYKLYSEATLLKPLEIELQDTMAVTADVKRLLTNHQKRRPAAEKKLMKLENEHKNAQEMKNIDEKVKETRLLFAWTVVEKNDEEYNKYKDEINTKTKPEAEKLRTSVKKQEKALQDYKTIEEDLTAVSTEAQADYKIKTDTVKTAMVNKSDIEHSLSRKKRKVEELNNDIRRTENRVEQVEKEKEKAHEEHFRGQEQKSRLVEKMKELDEEKARLNEKIETIRAQKVANEDELRKATEEKRTAEGNHRFTEDKYVSKCRELSSYERAASSNNGIARFGDTIVALCRAIEQQRDRFHDLPIGPIGSHITLKDESWAAAVEAAIGRHTLGMFIVSNSRDSQILQSMIPRNRGGPRPNISVMANMHRPRYELTPDMQPQLQNEAQRVVDVLTFENDAVFNILVDQANIDQQVLIRDGLDITDLGYRGLRNVSKVWNKACEQAYVKGGSRTFRAARGNPRAKFLMKDMMPLVIGVREELAEIEENRRVVSERLRQSESKLRELRSGAVHAGKEMDTCRRLIQGTVERRNRIDAQLSSAENAFDPSPYDQRIMQYSEAKTEFDTQRTTCLADIETLSEEIDAKQKAVQDTKVAQREAKVKSNEAAKKLENAYEDVGSARHRLKRLKEASMVKERELQEAVARLEAGKQKLDEKTANAMVFGRRPTTIDTSAKPLRVVERELTTLLARKDAEQQKRGGKTVEDIERDYLMAKKVIQDIKRKEDRIRHYVRSLSEGIKTRDDKLGKLGITTRKLVRAYFKEFMGKRNHDGDILFNTEEEELNITTKMSSHERGDGERHTTRDLRSLSGGERSFTTLCFMLGLAEVTFNPTRVMDEIDVFQDETNRRISFKLLVQFFVTFLPHRQIIIITPHSLPDIDPSPAVRIVKLDSPRDTRRSGGGGTQTRMDQYVNASQ